MKRTAMLAMIVLSMMGAMGCASHHETVQSVQVPPRVNLKEHEIIGVVEFSSSSKGKLGPLATSRFIEMARRDQGLVRIVSLGTEAEALRSVLRDRLDAEALRIRNQAQSQDPEFYAFLKQMEQMHSILGDAKTMLLLSTHRPMFERLFQPPRPELKK